MAGLIATRPGMRTRLFFRIHVYHGRKSEPKGLGEADYMRLVCAVHAQPRYRLCGTVRVSADGTRVFTPHQAGRT